jgi:DNA-directed RNA polymerase beta' subunit
MNDRLHEIDSIVFGVLSPEDILGMSVCNITTNKLMGEGSVYDERMGPVEGYQKCVTCNLNSRQCPGHFGYIELNHCIVHPLYHKMILSCLRCFCYKCSSLLVTEEQLKLWCLRRFTRKKRFIKILEKTEKINVCKQCKHPQPKFTFSASDTAFFMVCKQGKEKYKMQVTMNEIKKIFDNIKNEDVILLGLDPESIHPRNLILSIIPVLPPRSRPFIMADNVMCDDDLTTQYIEIIKANNHLAEESLPEPKRQKYIQTLKFRIKTLFDNSQGKAKHTNGRAIKGIKERLTGKDGQIRSNLMGKRVNQSARTVIGPDPTLRLGELAIPPEVASNLTVPETVCKWNMDQLTRIVNKGKANFVLRNNGKTRINLQYALFERGTKLYSRDIIVRGDNKILFQDGKNITLQWGDKIKRDGKFLDNIKYPKSKNFRLRMGDVVERQLRNGDHVLLNRQPTLHRGSMLAQRVVIREGKTFRMNLSICRSFNADIF